MEIISHRLRTLDLPSLAIPSNIAYGTAMFERGGVVMIATDDRQVEAWAGGLDGSMKQGGGGRRRVRLWLAAGELGWRCTGNPKDHEIFCKHCVAVALLFKNSDAAAH